MKERGIKVIDLFIEKFALPYMGKNKKQIQQEFEDVFETEGKEKIEHLLNKWHDHKDIAGWYLCLDEGLRRLLFDFYAMPLEDDKYTDSYDLNMALINGIPRINVFPFESFIVHQFYLMANNNSLELLKKITPGAYETTKEANIDAYGNGSNWSKAWTILNEQQKKDVVSYIVKEEI